MAENEERVAVSKITAAASKRGVEGDGDGGGGAARRVQIDTRR